MSTAEVEQPAPGTTLERRSGGTIRGRVARILALPAVVVLALLSLLAVEQIQQQRTSQDVSGSVRLALSMQDLVGTLQTERGITAAVLGGNDSFTSELGPARQAVDQQRATLTRLVRSGTGQESRVRNALRALGGLQDQREAADGGKADRAANFGWFTTAISTLSRTDLGLDLAADGRMRRGAATLQSLQDLTEATSQERAFLNGVFSAGGFKPGEFVQFAQMRAARQAALDRFTRTATAEQRQSMDFVFATGAARTTAAFEQVAIDAADGHHIVVNPQAWWSGMTTVLDNLTQLQQHVGSEIQLRAHDLQQSSAYRLAALVAVVLLCLAGSIYLAVLASRSITQPLAALASEADNVAASRLPQAVRRLQSDEGHGSAVPEDGPIEPEPPAPVQVPQRATSEIRSVATALENMQSVAWGLARDQAQQRQDTITSMANLGRRNQNLIRRQLGFITSLEREEIDPSALANLFELDHLATRMRRNAASLLVLVGASSPRQWTTPVAVADVVRAAISEVEEYRRVMLRRVDDAQVSGTVVSSIAHLLAELVENGLAFSPPDSDVEIQGRRLHDGYLIAVTDQGVGMSGEDLAGANARLRGEGDFIATPTRFLGHFVVGRLARETGVDVELLPSPVTGITARIMIPDTLLDTPAAVSAGSAGSAVSVRALNDTAGQAVSVHAVQDDGIHSRHSRTRAIEPSRPMSSPSTARPAGPPQPPPGQPGQPGRPQMPPSWDAPAARMDRRGYDPDTTPSSGIPILNHPAVRAHQQHRSAMERTITERTITERIATERMMSHPPQHGSEHGSQHRSELGSETGPQISQVNQLGQVNQAGQAHRPFTPPTGQHLIIPGTATSGAASSGSGDGETTRNGLRKRVPKGTQSSGPSTGPSHRVIDLAAAQARAAEVDSSPSEVRARMTALRAGFQRASGAGEAPGSGTAKESE